MIQLRIIENKLLVFRSLNLFIFKLYFLLKKLEVSKDYPYLLAYTRFIYILIKQIKESQYTNNKLWKEIIVFCISNHITFLHNKYNYFKIDTNLNLNLNFLM